MTTRTQIADIVLAGNDAAALRNLLDTLEHLNRIDAPAEALDAVLDGARIVIDPARLPAGVVTLQADVDYLELPSGPTRSVSVVLPEFADAGQGRISVLSPVGRAVLGRTMGQQVEVGLPDGRSLRLKILEVRGAEHPH